MKRAYSTPKARMIDFVYDEQVVATSTDGCIEYTLTTQNTGKGCRDVIREGAQTYSLVDIDGCFGYDRVI